MTEHIPTFEVGPSEDVAGRPVSLVYTRVSEGLTSSDLRCHALRCAVDTEARTFRAPDEHVDPAADVVNTAKMFLAFLEGGAA